jgi:hypothetical protein
MGRIRSGLHGVRGNVLALVETTQTGVRQQPTVGPDTASEGFGKQDPRPKTQDTQTRGVEQGWYVHGLPGADERPWFSDE